MNWDAIKFDWNQVRAFLATAEEGSLSAAARALGLTQPTLGRQVSALEDDLGVPLFERVGKTLELTPAGRLLAEHVREMGQAAERLSLVASGQVQSVEGTVKITANEMMSVYLLPEIVAALRAQHPGLVIEIISTNEISDLRRREADIAIRNAEPTEPEMFAKKIRMDKGGLYAAPDLLRRIGPVETTDDLVGKPMIDFDERYQFMAGLQQMGLPVGSKDVVALSKSHSVHWELVKKGVGIGANALLVGDRTPEVVRLLPDTLTFEFPVYLIAPRELKTSRRVRLVFDTLAEFLAKG